MELLSRAGYFEKSRLGELVYMGSLTAAIQMPEGIHDTVYDMGKEITRALWDALAEIKREQSNADYFVYELTEWREGPALRILMFSKR